MPLGMLVSSASTLTLGSLSIPLWILVTALAITRLTVKPGPKKDWRHAYENNIEYRALLAHRFVGDGVGYWNQGGCGYFLRVSQLGLEVLPTA